MSGFRRREDDEYPSSLKSHKLFRASRACVTEISSLFISVTQLPN